MKIQTNLCVCFSKINTKPFFFGAPKFPLTPKASHSSNIKRFLLRLSACDEKLL